MHFNFSDDVSWSTYGRQYVQWVSFTCTSYIQFGKLHSLNFPTVFHLFQYPLILFDELHFTKDRKITLQKAVYAGNSLFTKISIKVSCCIERNRSVYISTLYIGKNHLSFDCNYVHINTGWSVLFHSNLIKVIYLKRTSVTPLSGPGCDNSTQCCTLKQLEVR